MCRVARVVAPKKAKLKEAEATLAVAMKALEKKRADLRTVQEKLADLQASFDENNRKKQQLERDVDMCSKKLDRSALIVSTLQSSTVINWIPQSREAYRRTWRRERSME